MIAPPTPQQYALVAQMLQAHTQQPPRTDGGYNWGRRGFDHPMPANPNLIQHASRVLPEVPDPNAQGDWSYNQPWVNLPTVASQGYTPQPGQAMVQEDPASVFGAMRKALPASTSSSLHSHQQALIQRFMRNQRGKVRAV